MHNLGLCVYLCICRHFVIKGQDSKSMIKCDIYDFKRFAIIFNDLKGCVDL